MNPNVMTTPISKERTPTLAEWLQEWFETYKFAVVKKATVATYLYAIKLIAKFDLSAALLPEITEFHLQKMLSSLFEQGYSKSTITKVRITLQQAFQTAHRRSMILFNPALYIQVPQEAPVKKVPPLSHADQERLELACTHDPLGHLIIFLLRTGLRRAELCNLTWDDYSAERKEIYIRKSKTKAGIRTVPLLKDAQALIEQQSRADRHIFCNTKGNPVTPSSLKKLYQRLQRNANIPYLTNHVCRHTFVTRLCEKGVSAKAIAQIIGHAQTGYVLEIYAQLEQKQLRKAIYALEESGCSGRAESISVSFPPEQYRSLVYLALAKGLPLDRYIETIVLEHTKIK